MERDDNRIIVPMSAESASSDNRYSSRLRSRPAFMERDMVAPSWNALEAKNRARRLMKYDSGDADSGDADSVNTLFLCHRRQLIGSDVSFSTTLFFVIVGLSLLLLLAWRGGGGGGGGGRE